MQLRKSQESLARTVGWLVGCRREAEDEKKKKRKKKEIYFWIYREAQGCSKGG